MPGPVVNGVRKDGLPALDQTASAKEALPFLPLLNEGTIKLILLSSGGVLMARLRNTTDPDGERAYQFIRPLRVIQASSDQQPWQFQPYLEGLTSQKNIVVYKAAVASILDPDPRILQVYARQSSQECPPSETPVERLKRAFQEFTECIEDEA